MKKSILMAAYLLYSYSAVSAVIPESGFWHVDGWRGLGFSIEVQNDSLFVVTYAYDNAGYPLFYTSSGTIDYSTSTFTSTLERWGNGYCLACGYMPADNQGSAGTMSLAFTSPKTGTLTWPGGTLAIQRYDFGSGVDVNPHDGEIIAGRYQLREVSVIFANGNAFSTRSSSFTAEGEMELRNGSISQEGSLCFQGNCQTIEVNGTFTAIEPGVLSTRNELGLTSQLLIVNDNPFTTHVLNAAGGYTEVNVWDIVEDFPPASVSYVRHSEASASSVQEKQENQSSEGAQIGGVFGYSLTTRQ